MEQRDVVGAKVEPGPDDAVGLCVRAFGLTVTEWCDFDRRVHGVRVEAMRGGKFVELAIAEVSDAEIAAAPGGGVTARAALQRRAVARAVRRLREIDPTIGSASPLAGAAMGRLLSEGGL